ncbi:unnamed protein product [Urochloa humidicola]
MPPPPLASSRDWSELPQDAIASVFAKLGAIEIPMGAGLVCRSWLQAAKLPDLWRSVSMAHHKLLNDIDMEVLDEVGGVGFSPVRAGYKYVEPKISRDVLCAMARVAVDRSCGQLEVFVGKLFVTDELLEYIADRSPSLKALGLISCRVFNKGFTELISKCPLLEDLLLHLCRYVGGQDVYEAAGKACPQLKRFRLYKMAPTFDREPSGDALGVAAMHELLTLVLFGSDITNGELASVLDGCPHLENLDLRGCLNIVVDDELQARCARIKSLVLPRARYVCCRDVDFSSDSD